MSTQPLIQMLVNYWEIRPSAMGAHLDELIRKGVNHLASFIPWQAVESDISHTLFRFLQAVAERKMTVSLILTPEVGVHYANSGLPKDLFSKPENTARHAQNGPVSVCLPPNAFAMPSLLAPEFTKRYHNFLARIDALLADLGRTQPHLLDGVTAVLTSSYWKYYRSARNSSDSAFGGPAGDYSGCAAVTFRQRMEHFYSQREFTEPSLSAVNRWKTRQLEEVNRRWFYQQSEDVFRNRSSQFVRKKAHQVTMKQVELYTPEADPGFFYSNFLQLVSGAHADFMRFSQLLDEAATRESAVGADFCPGFIHWTGLGGFRTLSDSEKQFLILKSLLLMGGRGGGLLVDEGEWFSLSATFRARAEALARTISHGELRLKNQALYLAPHLWSSSGTLGEELFRRVGPGARQVSSIDLILSDRESALLVVDPTYIITQEVLQRLMEWTRGGRVLVLPRSPLYTNAARTYLENVLSKEKGMVIDLGISYRLCPLGDGKLVVYELPEGISMQGESLQAWQTFLVSVLGVAEIQSPCSISDGRLSVIPLQRRGSGMGLFILNGTSRPVAADILFTGEVQVSDLAISISGEKQRVETSAREPGGAIIPANRFALEVPPCGILPIAVDGMDSRFSADASDERRAAAISSHLAGDAAQAGVTNELPGFGAAESGEFAGEL